MPLLELPCAKGDDIYLQLPPLEGQGRWVWLQELPEPHRESLSLARKKKQGIYITQEWVQFLDFVINDIVLQSMLNIDHG